jgi:uncharacterized protein (TIGR03437 family)
MMSNVRNRCALAVLTAFFPVATFAASSITFQYTAYTTAAGSTGTATLNSGQSFNLETGAAVSSGGDLAWNGTTLTPVGKALAADLTALSTIYSGASGYAQVTQMLLQVGLAAGLGSSKAFTPAQGDVIGLEDNSGNAGKLLITAVGAPIPTITGVENNYSYIVPGLPNYGIAPGTLFIITGQNLASATTVAALQNPASGIPTSLNGASVSVTVGGVTTTPGIYYAIATQIAAVLPSNTPVGTGTVTVSYNGTASKSQNITVVASALGLDTYYGSGSGLGVATNATTGVLYSYTNSIPPGTTVVLWGSGLGATPDSDTTNTSTPHAVSNPPTFYVGGIAVTPLYAGRSVYPGVDQINLTIPASAPTGCGVSLVAVSGTGASSVVSNTVSLPIGSGVCSDPALGFNGNQLTNPTQSGNFTVANLGITQGTSTQNGEATYLSGSFQNYQGFTSSSPGSAFSLGSCIVSTSGGTITVPTGTITGLDAGTIMVTGPTGSQTLTEIANPLSSAPTGSYAVQVANSFLPATGGTFTFTGSGGANVGAFTTSISLSNLMTWTNESSITSVTRANGLNITWSGGAPNTYVYVTGTSASSTAGASATFVCYAAASAGQLTVPNYVLLALPAGNGTLGVANSATPASFTASGLSAPGVAIGSVSYSLTPTYN